VIAVMLLACGALTERVARVCNMLSFVVSIALVAAGYWLPSDWKPAAHARSCISGAPAFSAQCAQQKKVPSFSMPCPTMRHEQCAQVGATAWIAHSKLSNVQVRPFFVSVNDLS
jgi:hypothetical protein